MADVRGPTPRPEVASRPAVVAPRVPLPRPGLTTYELAANESPYAPLPGVLVAARGAAALMNRYPDPASTELREALGDRLGVGIDHVLVGAGSTSLLQQVLSAYCTGGDEVVLAWRTCDAYPVAIVAAGATGVPVLLTADGRHDLDAMAAAITERTKVVLLCSPNNPTGPSLGQDEFDRFMARVPEHVLVVLDEAYVDYVRQVEPLEGIDAAQARPQVLVLRTFSTSYGLAGLRVGYAVAQPHLLAPVAAVGPPFAVSSVASAAAVAALAEEEAMLMRVDAVVAERSRMLAEVRAAGWQVPDAQGNFVWLPMARATEFAAAAEERGIAVRAFDGDGVRVTMGEQGAVDRVIELVRGFPLPGF